MKNDSQNSLNDLIQNLWVITNELKRQSTINRNENDPTPELTSENNLKISSK